MAEEKVYDINEGVEISFTFRDRDGDLRDPTSGTVRIVSPSGTVTNLAIGTLAHPSQGVYTHDLVFTEADTWNVRATCDDSVAAVVKEKQYFVRKQRF